MNTLQYFQNLEAGRGDELRRDPYEGVGSLVQATGGVLSLEVEGAYRPVVEIVGPLRWRPPGGIKANVFCMYTLRGPVRPDPVDELNFRFGDTFAGITNGDEFLRRIRAPETPGRQLTWGPVEYVDERTYQGTMGIFRKRLSFRYQSEFRIALVPGDDEPYILRVGDLSDIVIAGPLSELNRRLVARPPGYADAGQPQG